MHIVYQYKYYNSFLKQNITKFSGTKPILPIPSVYSHTMVSPAILEVCGYHCHNISYISDPLRMGNSKGKVFHLLIIKGQINNLNESKVKHEHFITVFK